MCYHLQTCEPILHIYIYTHAYEFSFKKQIPKILVYSFNLKQPPPSHERSFMTEDSKDHQCFLINKGCRESIHTQGIKKCQDV